MCENGISRLLTSPMEGGQLTERIGKKIVATEAGAPDGLAPL
jgi:hypothetical protein